jgi:hypothetical protein
LEHKVFSETAVSMEIFGVSHFGFGVVFSLVLLVVHVFSELLQLLAQELDFVFCGIHGYLVVIVVS